MRSAVLAAVRVLACRSLFAAGKPHPPQAVPLPLLRKGKALNVAAVWVLACRDLLAAGMRIATPVCALVRNDTSGGFRVDRDGVALETSRLPHQSADWFAMTHAGACVR